MSSFLGFEKRQIDCQHCAHMLMRKVSYVCLFQKKWGKECFSLSFLRLWHFRLKLKRCIMRNSKAQYFYNVKNGSSNITSKSLSKNLSNGEVFPENWHFNSCFVLKTTKTPLFVFITEILWQIFWRKKMTIRFWHILWLTKWTCLIAEKKQMAVESVVDEGPGLAFIVYPEVDEIFF